jgi:hypothetical protein
MTDATTPCYKHPDRQSVNYCSKYARYVCDECMTCADPTLYCKFRTMCVIHELEKHPEEKMDARTSTG